MYFDEKTTELAPQLQFYEAATIFHPLLVQNAGALTETKVRALLTHVPKLNTQVWVDNLVRELPIYLAECKATPPGPWKDADVEALWHEPRFQRVGFWHRAALLVMLAQPSSAPIERVFSMLKTVVDDQQGQSLQDYQASSMMSYYNSRERARP